MNKFLKYDALKLVVFAGKRANHGDLFCSTVTSYDWSCFHVLNKYATKRSALTESIHQ